MDTEGVGDQKHSNALMRTLHMHTYVEEDISSASLDSVGTM